MNLVYRITLEDGTTLVHLGDSEPQLELFERFRDFWQASDNDLVLAPVWFLQSREGKSILSDLLQAGDTVGIHVPLGVSENPQLREGEFRDLKIMVTPGSKYQLPARR
jgi:hypothetical protein